MAQNNEILLSPATLFAFLKILPLILSALTFLSLAWWLSPYFILFSLTFCGIAWYWILYLRSFHYLITAEYIRITYGIFYKRTDQVELFRVKDYIITQSVLLQLCNLMCLTLKSTDPENPVIRLKGIPESEIMDTIRDRVFTARKKNNIYELN